MERAVPGPELQDRLIGEFSGRCGGVIGHDDSVRVLGQGEMELLRGFYTKSTGEVTAVVLACLVSDIADLVTALFSAKNVELARYPTKRTRFQRLDAVDLTRTRRGHVVRSQTARLRLSKSHSVVVIRLY